MLKEPTNHRHPIPHMWMQKNRHVTHMNAYWPTGASNEVLQNMSLFCRISFLVQGSFAKETYVFREPTNLATSSQVHYGVVTISRLLRFSERHAQRQLRVCASTFFCFVLFAKDFDQVFSRVVTISGLPQFLERHAQRQLRVYAIDFSCLLVFGPELRLGV